MVHAHQTIATALKGVLLVAGTAAGINVYDSRVYPHEKTKLPSINFYFTTEEVDNSDDSTGGTHSRRLPIVIEARVATGSASSPENVLRSLVAEIETAIASNPTLGVVSWCALKGIEYDLDAQENVVGLAQMTYLATFRTPAADPTTISG